MSLFLPSQLSAQEQDMSKIPLLVEGLGLRRVSGRVKLPGDVS